MKKFLSLVLALVMAMSLVTVSAGAKDFTDDGEIAYKEAVDVMSAVKVVDGYADGSFNPDATLTRGAAAKIICNMILGPTTAAALSADTAPFSDVPVDHVFAGYIAYCSQNGIISGYADGTFRPAGTLTGYAFMKMLLGALGYDAAVEGYVGANWSINVAKRALNIGLDKGNDDFVGTKAVTREEACLYAFNTLKATMVEYDNNTTITVGDTTIVTSTKAQEMKDIDGRDYTVASSTGDNTLQFCEKYFKNLKVTDGEADKFGRPAHVWKNSKDKVGTYVDDAVLVYTSSVKGTTIADDLDDADIDVDGDVDLYRNNKENVYTLTEDDVKDILKDKNDIKGWGNGVVVELYADDDVLERVVTIYTYLAEVTAITKDKASTKSVDERSLTLKYEDTNGKSITVKADKDTTGFNDVYGEVEEGDMVLVVPQGDNTKSEYALSVALPETVEGVITYSSNSSIKLDGESYKLAAVVADKNKPAAADKEVTVYLDAYGYVIGSTAKGDTDDKTVAVLKTYLTLNDDGELIDVAKVVYSDGTQDVIEIKDAKNVAKNAIYTYEEKDDVYTLTPAKTEKVSIKEGAKRMTVGGESVYFASGVQFIFVNDGKAVVKDGVQKITDKDVVVTTNDDGKITTVFVLGKASNIVSSSDSLLFVAKKQGTVIVKDENDKYVTCQAYDAYIDGEKVDNFYSEDKDAALGFYTIEVDEDTGAYILDSTTVYKDADEDLKVKAVDFDADTIVEDTLLPIGDIDVDLSTAKYADNDTDIEDLSDLKTAIDELSAGKVVKATVLYDNETAEAVYVYITAVDVAAE